MQRTVPAAFPDDTDLLRAGDVVHIELVIPVEHRHQDCLGCLLGKPFHLRQNSASEAACAGDLLAEGEDPQSQVVAVVDPGSDPPLVLHVALGVATPYWARNGPGSPGGVFKGTGYLLVLFAFFFVVASAVNTGQWPWAGRTQQPFRGLGDFSLTFIPTVILYAVFVLPALALWAEPDTAIMSIPTVIGYFYSCVVAVVITGLLLGNWPWRLAKHPAAIAAVAIVGNLAVGAVLYFLLLEVAQLLMGSDNVQALGAAIGSHAAEVGVCWVLWMMLRANVFGNRPTKLGDAANGFVRVAVTFILACATYVFYYFFLAEHVLHEPVLVGSMHGDALGFTDWMITWLLWYFLFLGSYGLREMREAI